MKMQPAFKDYMWGGARLVNEYNKDTPLRPVAESWEVSCHPDGLSVVANGEFTGRALADVLAEFPSLVGSCYKGMEFPLLIKLIDTGQKLSIQVHPNDSYAKKNENQSGKNEAWYIMDADKNAGIYLGFKEKMHRKELLEHIIGNTIVEHLDEIPIESGDFFEIPAGMLHSIGVGCLIVEVQQNSNVTYRVYDYERTDSNGNKREIHINKALDVIDTELRVKKTQPREIKQLDGYSCVKLTDWQHFSMDLLDIETKAKMTSSDAKFQCILLLDGTLSVLYGNEKEVSIKIGESIFIPAGIGNWAIEGKGKALRIIA